MKNHVKDVVQMRFGQADKLKIGRKDFSKDMESANLFGMIYIAEKIINLHEENPFSTPEEVIGELHKEIVSNWNKIQIMWPKSTFRIDLNRIIKEKT